MTLYISSLKDPGIDSDAVYLPVDALKAKSCHLTLASKQWEELYIELKEDLPENCLKFLRERVGTVYVKLPEQVTHHILKLLIELFPNLEGSLRKAFMKGDDIRGVLPQVW